MYCIVICDKTICIIWCSRKISEKVIKNNGSCVLASKEQNRVFNFQYSICQHLEKMSIRTT